ncbi:hypothetical protein EsH8_VII_000424 [Colletotrichum jinshuiense]
MSSSASQVTRSIRDAVTAIGNTEEVYASLEDGADLPNAFHEVAKALPTAQEALTSIKSYISKNKPKPGPENEDDKSVAKKEKEAAEKVQTRAEKLYNIFDAVIPPGDGPRVARYRSAASKGGRVEVLMKEILDGILVIAKPPAVTQDQVNSLKDALQAVSKIPPSLDDEAANSFNNYGTGPQSIHLGHGDQNINTGSGMMFNGKFMAPFHLPKSQ